MAYTRSEIRALPAHVQQLRADVQALRRDVDANTERLATAERNLSDLALIARHQVRSTNKEAQ